MSLIEQIKERTDLAEIAGRYTTLKRDGARRFKGLCPLHQEQSSSFVVYPDGHFYCYGCGAFGDVIDLIEKREGMTTREAIRWLAEHAGIALTPRTPEQEQADAQRRTIEGIYAIAANYYHAQLNGDNAACEYLQSRRLTTETIEAHWLGAAHGGLGAHLKAQAVDLALAKAAGVIREDGRDFFFDRVVIPYLQRGRVVYLSGRALNGIEPKYLHLPKPRVIYNSDALRGDDDLILCEGVFDALALAQVGYPNVIALNGTTLDTNYLDAVRKHTCVFVFLDANATGKAHARELAEQIGAEARVVSLPDGADDPAAFIASGATREQIAELLENARDLLTLDLEAIPADTNRVQLVRALEPILRRLATVERAQAQAILWHTIKARFNFTHKDIQGYERTLSEFRREYKAQAERDAKAQAVRAAQAKLEANKQQTAERANRLLSARVSLLDLHARLRDVLGDLGDLMEITLAASALPNAKPPVWLFIVGAPSSGKTELVRLLRASPHVYYLDTLSENAFVSGYVRPDGSDPQDLLPLLNGKVFVCKDLTTLFSLQEDTITKLLGDLASIYDGEFRKHTATRGDISYESSFGFLACITPAALNKHHRYLNIIGPRFLTYRVPPLTAEQVDEGFEILWQNSNRAEQLNALRDAVSAYSFQLSKRNLGDVRADEAAREYLKRLAKLLARGRGVIVTNRSKFKDADGQERQWLEVVEAQVEEPWRGYHQIESLARALALVHNRERVTAHELELARRVVLASMPPARGDALAHFADTEIRERGYVESKDMGTRLDTSIKTARNLLEELHALKILTKEKDGELAARYAPLKEFEDVIFSPRFELDHVSDYLVGETKEMSNG